MRSGKEGLRVFPKALNTPEMDTSQDFEQSGDKIYRRFFVAVVCFSFFPPGGLKESVRMFY